MIVQVGGSLVCDCVDELLARRSLRWPMRLARSSARRCAENARMCGAKTEPTHGAEPNITVHMSHAKPNVGGWVVGGVRVVAGGRMCGGWVHWWAVGVLWLGRWAARWLVIVWTGSWRVWLPLAYALS